MSEHKYRNPWAKPHEPQDYTRNVDPIEHKGCQIFHVLTDQWDVVKAGVCIAQRAGKSGAMQCAEVVEDMLMPTHEDVKARMLEKHGYL